MQTLSANVAEYGLGIISPDDAGRSAANLKLPAAPKAREMWAGQIAFAPVSVDDMHALLAWFEAMDGRLTSFLVPAAAGVLTKAGSHTATLASAVTAGDSTLRLTVSPVSGTIQAGTLLTIGTSTADAYQVCEVLADVTVSSNPVSVSISPRMRWAFSAGAPVTLGATNFRFRLADDEALTSGGEFAITHGVLSVNVVEAVHA